MSRRIPVLAALLSCGDPAPRPVAPAPAVVPSASSPRGVCVPAPDGKTLRKLGCESLCLGAPSAVAEACVADDMDAVIPPFWLPRMLTVSVGGTVVLRVHVAFGPLDGATPGDSSLVRLRARLSADGLGVEITDDPGRSCTAAKKNPDYAAGLPYRAAVDRVCAARGRYAWTNGRFVRAP